MPAMNFPSSPTNGQAYGQYVYDSTKGAWRVLADLIASAVPSPTAPTSPVSGDLWFNSNDGVLFMFFNDGNTSQWVEMKSNTASGSTVAARVDALEAKPNAMVPVIPASVAVGSGTSSVGTNGLVTFSGVSSLSLNSIFTSTYANYSVVIRFTSGTPANMPVNFRFRASESDSATSYQWNGTKVYYNGLAQLGSSGVTFAEIGYSGADGVGVATMNIFNPFTSTTTHASMYRSYNNENFTGGFWHNVFSSYDGFSFFPQNSTLTGTVQVYGYR